MTNIWFYNTETIQLDFQIRSSKISWEIILQCFHLWFIQNMAAEKSPHSTRHILCFWV